MASFICKCGERLSDFNCPNEVEYRVYSDAEWDNLLERDTVETWKIPAPKYSAWRCPHCERLYIFRDGESNAEKIYMLEE